MYGGLDKIYQKVIRIHPKNHDTKLPDFNVFAVQKFSASV